MDRYRSEFVDEVLLLAKLNSLKVTMTIEGYDMYYYPRYPEVVDKIILNVWHGIAVRNLLLNYSNVLTV
jgi:hypothetical protein